MSHLKSCLAAVALALVPHAVWAEDAPQENREDTAALFKQLDANSDGFVAASEVPQDQQRLMRRLLRTSDKDSDGKLSRDEFIAGLKVSRESAAETGAADRPGRPATGAPGQGGFDPAAFFARMDRNGDGKVTADEVPEERRARVKEMIERLDTNRDGALSREEFAKFGDRLPGAAGRPSESASVERPEASAGALAVLRALDTDGDGKLSKDEIAKATESLLALDKNGDGAIEPAELARAARPDRAEGRGPSGSNADAARQMLERLRAADKNGDGKLSKDEAPERLQRNFDRVDTNGDGQLDATELRAMAERFRGAQQNRPKK